MINQEFATSRRAHRLALAATSLRRVQEKPMMRQTEDIGNSGSDVPCEEEQCLKVEGTRRMG
jgi:hypothetical protein